MHIDNNTTLVLEGGGLRGVFTCGVLDCLMDHGTRFPFTVGVSAGACNGLSYMSEQRGRARKSNIDLMDEHHYVGFKYLVTQKCIMDFKLLFEDPKMDFYREWDCKYDEVKSRNEDAKTRAYELMKQQ